MRELDPELHKLALSQQGVLSMRQLAQANFRRRDIERRVERGAWRWETQSVVAMQLAPLSRHGKLWVAALHYENCALGGSSVLELHGLPTPKDEVIHIVGRPAGRTTPMNGCRVHSATDFVVADGQPDRVDVVTAVVQVLRWAKSDRQGIFQAIWAIQRGLLNIEEIQSAVTALKKSPGSAAARRRMRLISPGVHSMPESDFAQECRRRGLPEPARQQQRRDSHGRVRYTDAEFRLYGRVLGVEIDGLGHLAADVYLNDQWRANELLMQGAPVLRIPALALRVDPEPFFEQLQRALHRIALAGTTHNDPNWAL